MSFKLELKSSTLLDETDEENDEEDDDDDEEVGLVKPWVSS
jgi:chromatin segregation and condensation protein Rec8/ScpA/Scc1 (kleisin family)